MAIVARSGSEIQEGPEEAGPAIFRQRGLARRFTARTRNVAANKSRRRFRDQPALPERIDSGSGWRYRYTDTLQDVKSAAVDGVH